MKAARRRGLSLGLSLAMVTVGAVTLAAPAGATTPASLTLYGLRTSMSSASFPVAATGAIQASGTITAHGLTDLVSFRRGTFVVTRHVTYKRSHFNKRNCISHATEQGTYQVGSGTKAFSHATGNGTYYIRTVAVGCNPSHPGSISQTFRLAGSFTR
jgi:hypothetical protein